MCKIANKIGLWSTKSVQFSDGEASLPLFPPFFTGDFWIRPWMMKIMMMTMTIDDECNDDDDDDMMAYGAMTHYD